MIPTELEARDLEHILVGRTREGRVVIRIGATVIVVEAECAERFGRALLTIAARCTGTDTIPVTAPGGAS